MVAQVRLAARVLAAWVGSLRERLHVVAVGEPRSTTADQVPATIITAHQVRGPRLPPACLSVGMGTAHQCLRQSGSRRAAGEATITTIIRPPPSAITILAIIVTIIICITAVAAAVVEATTVAVAAGVVITPVPTTITTTASPAAAARRGTVVQH